MILNNCSGLQRCGKSCRLRWNNYLSPDIKRGNYTLEEEEIIIKSHELMGNKWSAIAAKLPGRTDNEIKNIWHTNLKKKIHGGPNSEKKKVSSIHQLNNNITEEKEEGLDNICKVEQSCPSPETTTEVSTASTYDLEEDELTLFEMPIIDESFWSVNETDDNEKITTVDHSIMDSDGAFAGSFPEDSIMDFWLKIFLDSTNGINDFDGAQVHQLGF